MTSITRAAILATAAVVTLAALGATANANAQWTKPKSVACDMIVDGTFIPCTAGN